ncbi:MAG: hypothetical protein Q3995_00845 [Eubacteriales bacterium]|nr:hypothetical protein [Eubacteriales bacterium]
MKKMYWLLLALFSAAAAFLRTEHLRTGFDADGLALHGCLPAIALPITLLLAAAVFLLLCRRYPAQRDLSGAMGRYFDFSSTVPVMLSVLGAFALIGTAVLSLLNPWRTMLAMLLSVFWFACAVSVIYALFALRRGIEFPGVVLLTPVCALVLQTIVSYRSSAADPVLGHLYIEILALAALTMTFLELSAFAFRNGAPRLFLPLGAVSVILCSCMVAERRSFLSMLFYAGFALILLGCCAAADFTDHEPENLTGEEN